MVLKDSGESSCIFCDRKLGDFHAPRCIVFLEILEELGLVGPAHRKMPRYKRKIVDD